MKQKKRKPEPGINLYYNVYTSCPQLLKKKLKKGQKERGRGWS